MSDTKITYLVDGHVRTLVFPECEPATMMEDGKGNLLSLANWGERYLRKYGAKTIRMIESLEGDFSSRMVIAEGTTAYGQPGGAA